MAVSLYQKDLAKNLLQLQLIMFVLLSLLLCIYSVKWGYSALLGGLSAWLPNVLFFVFTRFFPLMDSPKKRIVWLLAFGEGLKITMAILLLILFLSLFKALLIPVCLSYLSVLLVQIFVPSTIKITELNLRR